MTLPPFLQLDDATREKECERQEQCRRQFFGDKTEEAVEIGEEQRVWFDRAAASRKAERNAIR